MYLRPQWLQVAGKFVQIGSQGETSSLSELWGRETDAQGSGGMGVGVSILKEALVRDDLGLALSMLCSGDLTGFWTLLVALWG